MTTGSSVLMEGGHEGVGISTSTVTLGDLSAEWIFFLARVKPGEMDEFFFSFKR